MVLCTSPFVLSIGKNNEITHPSITLDWITHDRYALCLQVGVPGIILRCLEHMESRDKARPVAFLAKMTAHRPLAVQLLGKGLLDPRRMKSLLDGSCPGEVVLDVLMIVSDLARMDKVNS